MHLHSKRCKTLGISDRNFSSFQENTFIKAQTYQSVYCLSNCFIKGKIIMKSTTMYSNVEEVYNGWIAYDTLLKNTKKFRSSSSLNPALNALGDHLLVWYEDFGRQYLLAH